MAFPTGYTKYQEVTIDYTKVSADQTDFIVYVNLADLVKAGADIFDTCRSDGGDIRATKSDGTTQLATELVVIDTTAKTGELHIKFSGTLSSTVNTVIRIYYNGTDTALSVSDTYGRNNVWTAYKAVYHLQETVNTTSGGYKDSTGNYDATGVSMALSAITGKLSGRGQDFDGTDDYIDIPILGELTNYRVSYWAKTDDTTLDQNVVTADSSGFDDSLLSGFTPETNAISTNDRIAGIHQNSSDSTRTIVTDTVTLANSTWYKVAIEYDGSTMRLSTGGVSRSTASKAGLKISNVDKWQIGATASTGSRKLNGQVDEVRVSASAKGTTWETTEFNNQDSPSTFYAIGNESTGSSDTTVSPAVLAMTFSLPASTVTAVRNVSSSPSPLTLTLSLQSPTVTGGATVTPSPLTATFALPTPNILTPDSYYTVTAPLSLTFSIPSSTVTAETSISTTPSVLALTFSTPSPTIGEGTGVTASPSVLSATFSIPASTISVVSNISVIPEVLSLVLSIPVARIVADFWEDKFPTASDPFVDKVYTGNDNWADKF